ncbi:hypothetical protein GQ473_06455 [archaeon]|nr:hypothetical protein [archaeon]
MTVLKANLAVRFVANTWTICTMFWMISEFIYTTYIQYSFMTTINKIHAIKILDSRANWTVEVDVNGTACASPAGASTGIHETATIPADVACDFINKKLSHAFIGETIDQKKIDAQLKFLTSKIGANGSIATSFAIYNLLRDENQKNIFPYPLGNIFGGGAHGGTIDIQEVLICPKKAKTFPDAIKRMTDTYHDLKKNLKNKGLQVGMNDEGALTANIGFIELMDTLKPIADKHGCLIGLDVAASELYASDKYFYKKMGKTLTTKEQIEFILHLIKKYKLFYVEDPMHEEDFKNTGILFSKNKKTLITGDDLTTTNTERIKKAIGHINGMIVKPNQIGTVTQTINAIEMCKKNGITPVISHRSGETTDSTISKMALDFEIPLIKCGIADMRTAKLNELLRLWDEADKPKMAKF